MNEKLGRKFISKTKKMIVIEKSKNFSGIYWYDKYSKRINEKYDLISSGNSFYSAIRKMRTFERIYEKAFEDAKEF